MKIEIDLTDERLMNWIDSAFQAIGIQQWATSVTLVQSGTSKKMNGWIGEILSGGVVGVVCDHARKDRHGRIEGCAGLGRGKGYSYRITRETIGRGLVAMVADVDGDGWRVLGRLMMGEGDVSTADAIVQFGMFGRIVYG